MFCVRSANGSLYSGIFSAQGVRQGDPLSSLLFALTVQPVYEAVVRQHPTIKATAIHDDITLVGPRMTYSLPVLLSLILLWLWDYKCSLLNVS